MEIYMLLCCMLVAYVTPVFAEQVRQPGFMESILLSIHQRPWLMGVYVIVVGLPIILFISFMWPDKRFGPPDQPYYYKKSDDVQPDDQELSPLRSSAEVRGSRISEGTSEVEASSFKKRVVYKR